MHHIPHSFKIGDNVSCIKKEILSRPHIHTNRLRYDPHTILEKIRVNDFKFNIPPYSGLHPVFNVNLLRPYFLLVLEFIELNPTNTKYIQIYVQETISIDTIIRKKPCHTQMQRITLF